MYINCISQMKTDDVNEHRINFTESWTKMMKSISCNANLEISLN